jgi:hypothetical protein
MGLPIPDDGAIQHAVAVQKDGAFHLRTVDSHLV